MSSTVGVYGEVLARDGRRAALAPPRQGEVVDTVGAGDAFASVWLLGLRRGWTLETALQRAQEFASAVCRRRGATAMDRDLYRKRMDAWRSSLED